MSICVTAINIFTRRTPVSASSLSTAMTLLAFRIPGALAKATETVRF